MVKKISSVILIVALALFACILVWRFGSFILRILKFVNEQFFKLEAGIAVPLVFTVATASLGLAATLITQARTRKRAIEEAHRAKKVEIYHRLLSFITQLLLSQKPEFEDCQKSQKELVLEMANFRTEMSLWASPSVLTAFYNLTHQVEGEDPKAILNKVDPLYKAVRKDIGLSSFGLPEKFFIKSMLLDPSELS